MKISFSPRPTAITITMKPELMPMMCGIERRKPKFTPEASIMMLFGPGVTEVTKANSEKASRTSGLKWNGFRRVGQAGAAGGAGSRFLTRMLSRWLSTILPS